MAAARPPAVSWPISQDRTHLPLREVVVSTAAATASSGDLTLAFWGTIGDIAPTRAFLADYQTHYNSLTPAQKGEVGQVIDTHVRDFQGAAVLLAEYSSYELLVQAVQNERVRPFMRVLFDLTNEARLAQELPIGMLLFEGTMHGKMQFELQQPHRMGPGSAWFRRRATCTSYVPHSALRFATWDSNLPVSDQFDAIVARRQVLPVLFVHKIASSDVLGAAVMTDMAPRLSTEINEEKEVILAPFLTIAVMKEEWVLLSHPVEKLRGLPPRLYRVLFTHVTVAGEKCQLCGVVHAAEQSR